MIFSHGQDSYTDKDLLRALTGALAESLRTIVNYSYNGVLLDPYLPFAGRMFRTLVAEECELLVALSALLRDLGRAPVLDARVRSRIYTLKEDADSHAPVVARRMIDDLLPDVDGAQSLYRSLALRTGEPAARRALLDLAAKKERQRDMLLHTKQILTCS